MLKPAKENQGITSRAKAQERAIDDLSAREQWLHAEIAAGFAEANKGEFASDAEVERVLRKYTNLPS
jgi:predicted transcriptional regulator